MSSTAAAKSDSETKPKAGIWLQIQSLLNTINHVLIVLIGVYVTLLARSLNFQDTAMHMFMTVIGVSYVCVCMYVCESGEEWRRHLRVHKSKKQIYLFVTRHGFLFTECF